MYILVIPKHLQNCDDSGRISSSKDFSNKHNKEVALRTDLKTDIDRTWYKRYKGACNSMHIEFGENVNICGMETYFIIVCVLVTNLFLG